MKAKHLPITNSTTEVLLDKNILQEVSNDNRLKLTKNDLEISVRNLFNDMGAFCVKPPGNREDALLTFPEYFYANVDSKDVRLKVKGKFVVEIKSSGKTGAISEHVRQLLEWMWYHNVADSPLNSRERLIKDISIGFNDISGQLDNMVKLKSESSELVDFQDKFNELLDNFQNYKEEFEITKKGLLVINPYTNKCNSNKPNPFRKKIRELAQNTGLVLITWFDLLCMEKLVFKGYFTTLDIWCYLFKDSGIKKAKELRQWSDQMHYYIPNIIDIFNNVPIPQIIPNGSVSDFLVTT